MHFESWNEFLTMGGHGLYVWMAYAVTFIVIVGSYVSVRIAARRQVRELTWRSSTDSNANG